MSEGTRPISLQRALFALFALALLPFALFALLKGYTEWKAAPANRELIALDAELNGTVTRAQLEALVARSPHLRMWLDDDGAGRVRTPPRWDVQDWCAWVQFRPDGRLLLVRYATTDALVGEDYRRTHGMPANRCFGSNAECTRVSIWRAAP